MITQTNVDATGHIFVPQPDITIKELADILCVVLTGQRALFQADLMAKMPEGCLRHFTEQQHLSERTLLSIIT